jgi:hypothetical protein
MKPNEPIEIEDGAVPCSNCGAQPMLTGNEESKSYRCHCSSCARKMIVCHWSIDGAIAAWNDAQKDDEPAEPAAPCPYCGALEHGADTQPTSTCTRNLWAIIGSLREERETLRTALDRLLSAAIHCDPLFEQRWAEDSKQARAALNPNAGTTQAFPNGRWATKGEKKP